MRVDTAQRVAQPIEMVVNDEHLLVDNTEHEAEPVDTEQTILYEPEGNAEPHQTDHPLSPNTNHAADKDNDSEPAPALTPAHAEKVFSASVKHSGATATPVTVIKAPGGLLGRSNPDHKQNVPTKLSDKPSGSDISMCVTSAGRPRTKSNRPDGVSLKNVSTSALTSVKDRSQEISTAGNKVLCSEPAVCTSHDQFLCKKHSRGKRLKGQKKSRLSRSSLSYIVNKYRESKRSLRRYSEQNDNNNIGTVVQSAVTPANERKNLSQAVQVDIILANLSSA